MGFKPKKQSEKEKGRWSEEESLVVLKDTEWKKEPARLQRSAGCWFTAIWPRIMNGKFPRMQTCG